MVDKEYEAKPKICQVESKQIRLERLPKLHIISANCNFPPFRSICPSIKSYNYEIANILSDIVTPINIVLRLRLHLQNKYNNFGMMKLLCPQDSESLFTNIPLDNLPQILEY